MDPAKEMNNSPERFEENENDLMKIFLMIKRRKKLTISIVAVCFVIGIVYILYNASSASECRVAINFSGIEKHEYPNGEKFRMNDLIAPDAVAEVAKSIQDPGKKEIFEKNSGAFLFVEPFIPVEVQEKAVQMRKVEKKTLEYFPNQYYIRFIEEIGGPFEGRVRTKILYGLMQSFERRFYDYFVKRPLLAIELQQNLVKTNDYIDSFNLLNNTAKNYMGFLDNKIEEAGYFKSAKTGKSFVDLKTELENIIDVNLLGVDSVIYYYSLSKYQDFLLTKTKYKIRQMEKDREKKMLESEIANNLLKQVLEKDKSLPAAAVPMGTTGSQIIVDADTLEKLNKKEYLNLLVQRSLEAGVQSQNLGVDKKYMKEYIDLLEKKRGNEDEVSAKAFVERKLEEIRLDLARTSKAANDLNEEYMISKYSDVVKVIQEPRSYNLYERKPIIVILFSIIAGIIISIGLAYILDLELINALRKKRNL